MSVCIADAERRGGTNTVQYTGTASCALAGPAGQLQLGFFFLTAVCDTRSPPFVIHRVLYIRFPPGFLSSGQSVTDGRFRPVTAFLSPVERLKLLGLRLFPFPEN
jgi:hypothetical protein